MAIIKSIVPGSTDSYGSCIPPSLGQVDNARSERPFLAREGEFEGLRGRMYRALSNGDARTAVDAYLELKGIVENEVEQAEPRMLDERDRWTVEGRVVAERSRRRFRELAAAGTQIVHVLAETLGNDHVKTRMIRALTLRCVNESAKWGMKLLSSAAWQKAA